MPLDAGAVLNGRYEILGLLSAGGMGEVYKAADLAKGRAPVALKRMMLDRLAAASTVEDGEETPEQLVGRKFDEEVEVLRRLDFPGIPGLVDAFSHEGARCIVMDFIEGDDLERLLRDYQKLTNGPVPEDRVVQMAIALCRILEHLHAQDLIHRDVKPANVIHRKKDRQIFLVDFGLARGVGTDTTKTLVGTVGYAPLEQFEGKPEPRSDQYALGATMHHLLTGEPPVPFQMQPVEQVRPEVHPELAAIVNRAVSMNKDDRFPNLTEMRLRLVSVLEKVGNRSGVFSAPPTPAKPAARPAPEPAPVLAPGAPVPQSLAEMRAVSRGRPWSRRAFHDVSDLHENQKRAERIWTHLHIQVLLVLGLLFLGYSAVTAYAASRSSSAAFDFFAAPGPARGRWTAQVAQQVETGLLGARLLADQPSLRPGFWFRPLAGGRAPRGFRFALAMEQGVPATLVGMGGLGVLLRDNRVENALEARIVAVRSLAPKGANPLNFVAYDVLSEPAFFKETSGSFELRLVPRGSRASVQLFANPANDALRMLLAVELDRPSPGGPEPVYAVGLYPAREGGRVELGGFEVLE